ncbi:MAG: ABC transporter permease [Deltaproteobacteria bacterium]|nr:ABC transporter permease [Deltaproteobacteria bacterium]
MLHYILKRLVQLIPVLFLVSFIVFFIIHLIPGDPVEVMLGEERYDRATYELLKKQMGLDDPIYVQYFRWLKRTVQGDLGYSLRTKRPVFDTIKERYPATIYLAVSALVLGTLIAIPAGTVAAVKQNTIWDYLAMGFALFGIAVPNFWLALLLILGLGLYLGWFPTMGYVDPSLDLAAFLRHMTLPAIVLGTDMASTVTRYIRAEMLEQLRLDYVRTARAKGLPARLVIYKHTLKNSLIGATTAIGLHIGRLLGGSTVVETVFAWPGVARLVLEAVYARDYPVLQGTVLLLALTYVGVNLIVDVLYKWLDPRIRLE